MKTEDFEAENTEYFQEKWLEYNPEKAYMLNDGDLSHYYENIDRDGMIVLMLDLYEDYLN